MSNVPILAQTTTTDTEQVGGEIGLGTLLGSNLFNGLFIVSVAALIQPFAVRPGEVWLGLGFGILTVVLMIPGRKGELGRGRGFLLLGAYAASTAALLVTGFSNN